MRSLAAVLLSLFAAGLSVRAVRRMQARCRALGELVSLFGALTPHGRAASDAYLLLKTSGAAGTRFGRTVLSAAEKGRLPEVWRTAAADYADAGLLSPAERSVLADFAAAFGETSLRGFGLRCAEALRFFTAALSAAEDERRKRQRLTLSLGAAGAALIFIVLI